jgi:hypothetical protein
LPPAWWSLLVAWTVSSMAMERREHFGPPRAVPREYRKSPSSPCPALSYFHYLQMKAGIRIPNRLVHEVEGHTQTDFHYRFPGLFHRLQSSVDVYMDGRVVVRDSRKFLLCKMSRYSKMSIRDTCTQAQVHPEKHNASEGRHGWSNKREVCAYLAPK